MQSAVEKLLVGAVSSRQGELQVKCWQEAAPMPGSTQRDAVESLQLSKSRAAALKLQKAPLLLAGFSRGAAGRFWGERGARGEKLCGFEVLVWSE